MLTTLLLHELLCRQAKNVSYILVDELVDLRSMVSETLASLEFHRLTNLLKPLLLLYLSLSDNLRVL